MKRYFRTVITCMWILAAMPVVAATSLIYLLRTTGNTPDTVDVIDPVSNKIVQSIGGIPKPHGAVFSPDGNRAYITSETSENNLVIVDTKTGKISNKVVLSGRPNLPAITKDGKRVIVCIREPGPPQPISQTDIVSIPGRMNFAKMDPPEIPPTGAVDIVDTVSMTKIKSIPTAGSMHDCYTTPDDKYIVAGSNDGEFLTVIDLQTYKIAWQIPYNRGVQSMAIEANPDGSTRRIFVCLRGLRGFVVVDFALRKEVARIEYPDTSLRRFRNLTLYEVEPHTHGIGISPDGKTLWANGTDANAVFVYSLPDLKFLKYVPMPEPNAPADPTYGKSQDGLIRRAGGRPQWLTFTADNKTAYIVCADANVVTAVDVKTMERGATITVGRNAQHVATLVRP